EVNPLPGLTPNYSDLVLIAKACGMEYDQLIAEIMTGGLRRLREKKREERELEREREAQSKSAPAQGDKEKAKRAATIKSGERNGNGNGNGNGEGTPVRVKREKSDPVATRDSERRVESPRPDTSDPTGTGTSN